MINRFTDDNAFLNDFWACPVSYEGMSFLNVGQAFVASKTNDRNERVSICHIGTAREVMLYGQKMKPRPEAEEILIKEELYRQKFSYPVLAAKLLATLPNDLVDGHDWISDPAMLFWQYDLKREKGSNQNGILMMQIRSRL